jgi:hypothetical protein
MGTSSMAHPKKTAEKNASPAIRGQSRNASGLPDRANHALPNVNAARTIPISASHGHCG